MKKIKRFQWSKTDMQNAFNAVKSSSLLQRSAAIQYNIPRATLGKYLRGDCNWSKTWTSTKVTKLYRKRVS